MTGKLPALILLVPALLMARDFDAVVPSSKQKISVSSLLPPGSLLAGVMLPRYDQDRRLVGVLRAKTMTLVNSEILDGAIVSVELFNPDSSRRGRIDLSKARFDQGKGTLSAKETVLISAERLTASGAGLIYEVDQSEGFLLGPVTTRILAPLKTTMNPAASSLRATALVGASVLALPLAAAPGQDPALPQAAATEASSQGVSAGNAQTRAALRDVLSASAEATRSATAFLEQEELLAKAASSTPPPVPQAVPLEVKPGPNDTVINCDGGMYFDANNGVLVYLKNVTVADPRFSLDGANEIKVFFEKKPDKASEEPKPDAKPDAKPIPGGMNVRIGDVERVVATGVLHLLQKPDANNEAIEASGAIFTYHFKTGEVILSGGKPWVKKGGMITRAKQSNQTIRIIDGKFTFSEGGTETILPLDQINPKKNR